VASGAPQIIYSSSWPYATTTHYASAPVAYAAGPVTYSTAPVTYTSSPVTYTIPAPTVAIAAPISTQYHAQDELGQASFGYSHPGQAHAQVRDAFGQVRGSYAYIGADGKEAITNYVADANGFRVASNNLPIAPAVPIVAPLVGPSPVSDTAEVAQAKAEHAKAVADAIARNAEADKADAAEKGEEKAAEKVGEENKEAAPAVPAPAKEGEVITALARRKRSPGFLAAPVVTYSAHVPTYGYAVGAPTVIAGSPLVRTAVLTRVHTPHSVTYRVD